MKISSRQSQDFILGNYLLQTFQVIESLRALYPDLVFEEIADQIINVVVPEGSTSYLDMLNNETNILSIPTLYGLNAREALIDANILPFHDYPFGELRGRGIVIGFIDTGIDYTHVVFKNEDNTSRILRIWDQTIEGNPPTGYSYGTEYTKEQLDEALRAENPYEVVPTRDEIGHGTFLAGIAAGDDKTQGNMYIGGAPDAGIVMVKLRPAKAYLRQYYIIDEATIAYQENDFIAGVSYLLQIALELRRPLVICVGIGNNNGAHDGTTIAERYMNSLTTAQDLVMVVAGGNEANSGHHFSGRITTGAQQNIEINVADGESGFIVSLWAVRGDILAVSMRSPIGQVIAKVPVIPNETTVYSFNLEQTTLSVTYNYPNPQTGSQNILMRFERPTPGLWSITVYGEDIVEGNYNLWLPRNGFILEGTRFLRSDSLVTVSIPSTGEYMITLGAYDYIDQSIYVGSGRGFAADNQVKPEIIAPGVNIEGPQPGGGYTTYVGTSAAAAITASAIALLMQWAILEGNLKEMNTRIARGILIRGATRRIGVVYPNPAEGYGRLDLRNAIARI